MGWGGARYAGPGWLRLNPLACLDLTGVHTERQVFCRQLTCLRRRRVAASRCLRTVRLPAMSSQVGAGSCVCTNGRGAVIDCILWPTEVGSALHLMLGVGPARPPPSTLLAPVACWCHRRRGTSGLCALAEAGLG